MHPYTTEYVKLTNEEWQRVFSGLCSSRFRFQVVFAVIGAAMSIFGFVVGEDMLSGKLLIYAGVGSLGGAIGDRVYLNWYLKKYVADPQNDKLFAETRSVVDESGIKLESKSGAVNFYPWELIFRAEDFDDIRLLYIGKLTVIVMAKRSHTPEDWDSLAQWIAAKVPSVK